MKIVIKKEFDGKRYVGSCENIAGCYVQSDSAEQLIADLREAIEIYRQSYSKRHQTMPEQPDAPQIDKKIRFNVISSEQLTKVLLNQRYHIDVKTEKFVLLMYKTFPFKRLLIPKSAHLSPLIIAKIFGQENIIFQNRPSFKINSSA